MTPHGSMIRAFAVVLAVTFGWSVSAACVGGTMSTPSAQMACCENGHHTCGHDGRPTDCCKDGQQASQFTVAAKITAPLPQLILAQALGALPTSLEAPSYPNAMISDWSPPDAKHPTYLRLSTLRI